MLWLLMLFWEKSIQYGKLDLRISIKNKFGLECMSWNNGKIGELILKLYCDKLKLNKWDVKN